jgi:uncharacterized membrane protein
MKLYQLGCRSQWAAACLLLLPVVIGAQSLETSSIVHADFSDFANLHPIVVHLPVVLLPLAFLAQLASLFVWRQPLQWVTLAALVGGVAGAVLAVTLTHPHTHELTQAAGEVLDHHDTYASWTLWLAVAALVATGLCLWLRQQRWLHLLTALLIGSAAVMVGITGHYGGTLVYIHGVGVQGNYVEGEADLHAE